ncbi:MAG: hypothetical protein ONB46_23940 [candidate division KSB1 bacterium]|nr:hypothetical protein [candidate division KSB1 bacterium]MDZ7368918.1 hypothetical protein [candidate division KSB1 bacterium]MDZ7406906.1 hypothetical protein [candidate division KSB1 bacterium]
MAKTIKVSCNGAGHHVNEVDLDKILKPLIVTRSTTAKPREIPERSVLPCQFCREGKVVVTREMVEDAQK